MNKPTIVRKLDRIEVVKESNKTVWEYNVFDANDIDIAKSKMSGRYPSSGLASNAISTMVIHLIKGSMKLTLESGQIYQLEVDDQFYLPPKTWYSLEGDCELLLACSPAWKLEQSLTRD